MLEEYLIDDSGVMLEEIQKSIDSLTSDMKTEKDKVRKIEVAKLSELEKNLSEKDKNLIKLLDVFNSKPDFMEYGDLNKQGGGIEMLQKFSNRIVKT